MFQPKRTPRPTAAKTAERQQSGKDEAFSAIRAQADRAFRKAAKSAVAENSAMGIATHGAKRGKLTVCAPVKRRKAAIA